MSLLLLLFLVFFKVSTFCHEEDTNSKSCAFTNPVFVSMINYSSVSLKEKDCVPAMGKL